MNKLIFGLLLLVTQGVWAQLDWKDLDEDYKKLYVLCLLYTSPSPRDA